MIIGSIVNGLVIDHIPAGKGIDENWLAAYAEEVAEAVKTVCRWLS